MFVAVHGINYRTEDVAAAVEALTKGRGVLTLTTKTVS